MLASLCLFTCALLPAQAESPPAWLLVPHLSRGQELVYNGSFKEEVVGQAVQFSRNYGLESRVLVLETQAAGARLSLLTTLKQREPGPARPEAPNSAEGSEISSVRLELARLDLQGHLTSETGRSLAVALEGPATVETGAFVPFPNNRVGGDQPWEVNEEGRPPWTWRAAGTEPVNGLPCLKLVGVQQSPDWDRPRADRTAWRRQDTVWVSARLGIASRVERTIEQREPARREATHRSVATLELQSSLVYPAPLLEDCRQEILRAQSFAEAAEPLAREPGQGGPRAIEALLTRITLYQENQPPTPYRPALLQVKRRLEAVLHGEVPPAETEDNASPASRVAVLNQPAPDFVATRVDNRDTVRLSQLLGRPVLLIFYNPQSPTVEEQLRFGQKVTDSYRKGAAVLGLAVSSDPARVLRQRWELHLTFPIVSGNGLRVTYGVETTPKLIILDAGGAVRASFLGWSREIPEEVSQELKHWLSGGN